ncbi:prolactin releasing hormone 2 [Corythoichthys intestinalis]|uniref:prolactin releasing hormone 2 n=1 Tax=Corythoichthys intestinalis TaxID=161448 RepID=UPI0025A5F473|nr:prolactin releasing hormone 2 [Corythoichthys intestinalis]
MSICKGFSGVGSSNNYRPRLLTSASYQSSGMLPWKVTDFQARSGLPASLALFLIVLLSSCSLSSAHSTTVEHDFHIVHNVDNRSPEIDPFWYVGRGVRPIGRFGKRQNRIESMDDVEMQPVVRMLELLFNSLQNKENLDKVLHGENGGWLP